MKKLMLLVVFAGLHPVYGQYFNKTPFIKPDGVMEIGKYLDFHPTTNDPQDYAPRLWTENGLLHLSSGLRLYGGNVSTTNLILAANYPDSYRWKFKTTDRGQGIDLDFIATNGLDQEETMLRLSPTFTNRPELSFKTDWFTISNGNVGIGTISPASKLHLAAENSFITIGNFGAANNTKGIHFTGFRDTQPNYFGASIEAAPDWACCNGFPSGGYPGIKRINLNFYVHDNIDAPGSKKLAMTVHNNGNVGIGTATPNAKLAVNGNIRAREVRVEAAPWPDYVFEEGYELPDLRELAEYIKTNKRLPGMPSAKEVEADGVNLGEMNRLLLEKVEELTLHLIGKEKAMESQEKENLQLKKQLLAIERRLLLIESK